MSAPYDRPAPGGFAGGCSCDWCGVIFIGAEGHDGCCAVCAASVDRSGEADETANAGSAEGESAASRSEETPQ